MATDRDEQQRQQAELEEIRRSFAEMGARMGSLFEPTELDEVEQRKALPPSPSPAASARSRWWAVAALALVFLLGGVGGYLVSGGPSDEPDGPPAAAASDTTRAPAVTPPPPAPPVRTVVPDACLETAEKGDQTIAYLIRNIRDNRLSSSLKSYTIASQACRKEASP